MRHLKMLGLALVAATALMAISGAGAASATRLCKAAEKTCSAANTYPAGTEIGQSMEKETLSIFRNTESSIMNTCTGSEMKWKTSNESGASVEGLINTFTFTGCTDTTKVLKNGSLAVSSIAGTSNGTVTAKEFEVTMNLFGVSCTYGAGAGTVLGTLTGGSMATIDHRAVYHLTFGGLFCPITVVWEASYTVTNNNPLFVTS